MTGFFTINATVLGLGANFQKAWLFLFGGLISALIVAVAHSGERVSHVLLMRAIQLEDELNIKDNSIVSLWTAFFYGTQRLDEFRNIARIKNIDEKAERIRRLKTQLYLNKYIFILYLAILGQIALGILLPLILGWEFF